LKVILLLAAVIRVSLLATAWNSPNRLATPDSEQYYRISDTLAQTGGFSIDGQPEVFRTPGYPFFLLIGIGLSWQAVAMAQVALDVLLVYLTFLLGAMVCSQRVGLWAAGLQAINPVAVASSVRMLSDGLFAFLLILSILLLVHHLKTAQGWSLVGFALVGSVACYVRPVGLLFLGVSLLLMLVRAGVLLARRRDPGRVRVFVPALAAGGIMVAAVLPWVIRNGLTAGYWGFSSVSAEAVFAYQAPAVISELQNVPMEQARARLWDRLAREGLTERSPVAQLTEAKRACGMEVLRNDPWLCASIHLRGDLAVWAPGGTEVLEILGLTRGGKGTLEVLRREGVTSAARHYFSGDSGAVWAVLPLTLVQLAGYVLAILAAVVYLRPGMDVTVWLVLVTILTFALVPGPAGHPRFQTPIVPLLSIAAGAGAVWIGSKLSSRRASG
jgi:4-amino-4-deoxy-L-arabinose transferase-like glycosyltransferase